MRDVLLQDVVASARVLAMVPRKKRKTLCRDWFDQASEADRYRDRHSKPHPLYGNGTLSSVVQDEPMTHHASLHNESFVHAMTLVLLEHAQRLARDRILAKKPHHHSE